MKVVVTGAGGMLGQDVIRAARLAGHDAVALPHGDLDITNAEDVLLRLRSESPDAVVNCAAYTDVDGAEDDLRAAMEANADGARTVARAAAEAGASVLYPSTDYVFDGLKDEPYLESDEPRPRSVYAQSKLAGEHETRVANERHFVVRSAWLFGTGGRNFVETMLRLAADHGEVSVVRDQVGSPTYTGHLAEAIVRLIGSGAHGLHHVAGGGSCSWHDFAAEIFLQAGVDCRLKSSTTDELGRPAPRPARSVLVTERSDGVRLPEWQASLAAYLDERAAPP